MKARKLLEIKHNYHFEAPIVQAKIPVGLKNIDELKIHSLDLNEYMAPRPDSVVLVRVSGESMIDENIFDGDLLVVNRSKEAKDGSIVISSINGEMTVKTLRVIESRVYLFSANSNFLPREILSEMDFKIQGVVQHVIHKL